MVERWWREEALSREIAPDKSVLDVRHYFNDFAHEARNAQTSVLAQSMGIAEGPSGTAAMKIFSSAPPGVGKTLLLDYYTRLMPDGDKIEPIQKHIPTKTQKTCLVTP